MPLLSDSAMCSKPPDLALGQEKLFSSGSADVRAFGPGGSAWPVTLFQEHPELGHLRLEAETDRQTARERAPPSPSPSSPLCSCPRGPATGLGSELSLSLKVLPARPRSGELTLNGARREAGAQGLGRAQRREAKGPPEPGPLRFGPGCS